MVEESFIFTLDATQMHVIIVLFNALFFNFVIFMDMCIEKLPDPYTQVGSMMLLIT